MRLSYGFISIDKGIEVRLPAGLPAQQFGQPFILASAGQRRRHISTLRLPVGRFFAPGLPVGWALRAIFN
jgi:hypothetical protein